MPACLCNDCQRYDVLMSSRSDPSTCLSVLSSCPSSPTAESTSGLADIDVVFPEPMFGFRKHYRPCVDLPEDDVTRPIPQPVYRSFLSRPSLGFADLSSPCFLPASNPASFSCPVSSVAVGSSSVAVPFSCSASSVAVGPSSVQSGCPGFSSVAVLSSCPASSVAVSSVHVNSVGFVSTPPCRMSSFASGSVSPGSIAAPSSCSFCFVWFCA